MTSFYRRLAGSARRRGLRGAIGRALYLVHTRYRERELGVDTEHYVSRDDLGYDQNRFDYEPVPYRVLDLSIKMVPSQSPADALLDYGSGMGRVLVVAARHGYREVLGVEQAPWLCAVARSNLSAALVPQGIRFSVVNTDATTFEVPDHVNVFFFFNPFQREVLDQTLDRIRESLTRSPRVIRVLYVIPPDMDDRLALRDWLVETDRHQSGRFTLVLYRHAPAAH